MRIQSVRRNEERQVFVVKTWRGIFEYPYGKTVPAPSGANPVVELFVDSELADEGFTYRVASGDEGSVLLDQVLEYNEDPKYLRNMLLYQLTLEAQRQLQTTSLSRREIIRRLGTSPAQFYRLIDQTNYTKSIDKVLALLQVLGCDVELTVRRHGAQGADGGHSLRPACGS
ncbi:MAG: helix-turn-helix domain-containing protein [Actinomycetota bacterium]|nr:helix-turn-helix domain-containing protein [Actinomycetota bacterium]